MHIRGRFSSRGGGEIILARRHTVQTLLVTANVVDLISKQVLIDKYTLCKIFKKITGQTIFLKASMNTAV